ncbi:MAG: endolytic transglycosylase MltG, partial [Deltaproteobacteria bacterium]|nr:endolytic transglycosylase MltG [Deltaproteobacteria bacterium]
LPPGPIASPGAAALRAVLEPAPTNFLFFVSRNDGTHIFARGYAEHEQNVDRYQRSKRRKSRK